MLKDPQVQSYVQETLQGTVAVSAEISCSYGLVSSGVYGGMNSGWGNGGTCHQMALPPVHLHHGDGVWCTMVPPSTPSSPSPPPVPHRASSPTLAPPPKHTSSMHHQCAPCTSTFYHCMLLFYTITTTVRELFLPGPASRPSKHTRACYQTL